MRHLVLLAGIQAAFDAHVIVATLLVGAGTVYISNGSCAAVALQPVLQRNCLQVFQLNWTTIFFTHCLQLHAYYRTLHACTCKAICARTS